MKAVYFSILFLYIYGWIIAAGIDFISLISLGGIFYICVNNRINKNVLVLLFVSILYLVYALFIITVSQSLEVEMLLRVARWMITLLGGYAIVLFFKRKGVKREEVIWWILLALTIHSLLMVVMFLIEPVRNLIYSLTGAYNIVNLNFPFRTGLRITGLTYGLSQTSVVQSWGVIISIFMLLNLKTYKYNKWIIISSIPVNLIAIMISGRSGLVILILSITILMIAYFFFNFKNYEKIISQSFKIFIVSFVGLMIFLIVLMVNVEKDYFGYTISHVSEVTEVLTTGSSYTIEVLKGMYFVPEDDKMAFFGSGFLDRSELNIRTDVGYVRMLFHSGFFGSFLYYSTFLLAIVFVFITKFPPTLKTLILVIFLSTLILHGKEVSVFTRTQWSIQVLLLSLCLLYNRR